MRTVNAKGAPDPVGPYSHAAVVGNMVFTSGQIALNPETNTITAKGIAEETEQVCRNLKVVLEECGSSLEKVVKTNCYLQHISDFAAFNEVYGKYFTGKPARSCVEVGALPKGALVEVEVIAEI